MIRSLPILTLLVPVMAFGTGCVVETAPPPRAAVVVGAQPAPAPAPEAAPEAAPAEAVVVETAPPEPAPVVEVQPAPPAVIVGGPEYVWVPGYHRWDGRAYVWTRGAYVARPRRGAIWVHPHWEPRGHGRVWIGGHWR